MVKTGMDDIAPSPSRRTRRGPAPAAEVAEQKDYVK
jgi:hypothetical protein